MLSLSYPHERVPWAALPTMLPFFKELLKLLIIVFYLEFSLAKYTLTYFNAFCFLAFAFTLWKRLTDSIQFHKTVYVINMGSEGMLMSIFLFATLRDQFYMERNILFHLLMLSTCIVVAVTSTYVRDKIRYKSLSRVDFAQYESDFDALVMMFTLHELIEGSSYDDKEDFILRGFVERHIEICESPNCQCIKFY